MREAIAQLDSVIHEWLQGVSEVPEVDWGRMKQLEFQDVLRRRNALAQTLSVKACAQCPDFESHVSDFLSGFFLSLIHHDVLVSNLTWREGPSCKYRHVKASTI